jgi:hypothetical protein
MNTFNSFIGVYSPRSTVQSVLPTYKPVSTVSPMSSNVSMISRFANVRPIQNTTSVITTNPLKLTEVESAVTIGPTKQMTWGEPTWFFFHTMAEKIYEDKFNTLRVEFMNLIYMIATNLPCPSCSAHAKLYLSGINFSAVVTKQQLKDFLWNFHNSLNNTKNFPLMSHDDLENKYALANTRLIIYNFMSNFEKKNRNTQLLAEDFHRQHMIVKIKSWINDNIQFFAD